MTQQELQRIVESLKETTRIIQEAVAGLPNEVWNWKPSETEFSGLEHVCHLRDIEELGYAVRIARLLGEKEPFLPDLDGNRLAEERAYNSQNLGAALLEFIHAREKNTRTIRDLSPDQLSRSGTLENVGSITLERLLLMMHAHDQDHLKELSALRRRLATDHSASQAS